MKSDVASESFDLLKAYSEVMASDLPEYVFPVYNDAPHICPVVSTQGLFEEG